MYVPPAFEETRLSVLHEAIRAARLMTLVTFGTEGLEASHVPITLDPGDGDYGAIRGHVARANPQWRRVVDNTEALAIFDGPNAYVSPSFYPSKKQHGKVVPTWNYVVVHAYGTIEFFDDTDGLMALVTEMTERHETIRPDPWAVTDAPADFIQGQLKGIVGFRLPIRRLDGKWKLSQNRSAEDREGVANALKDHADAAERAIFDQMTSK